MQPEKSAEPPACVAIKTKKCIEQTITSGKVALEGAGDPLVAQGGEFSNKNCHEHGDTRGKHGNARDQHPSAVVRRNTATQQHTQTHIGARSGERDVISETRCHAEQHTYTSSLAQKVSPLISFVSYTVWPHEACSSMAC